MPVVGGAVAVPVYVPVWPARQHTTKAYAALEPEVRVGTVPLWNLPKTTDLLPDAWAAMYRRLVRKVHAVHEDSPGWIDAPFIAYDQIRTVAKAIDDHCSRDLLRPVTGPERHPRQQAFAVGTARKHRCGLGIRVTVPDTWDERADGVVDGVVSLLRRLRRTAAADLLLDMAGVPGDRPDAGEEARRALAALLPLASWRTTAVLGGGFPRLKAEMLASGTYVAPRPDWTMWHTVRSGNGRGPGPLGYGDYGVQPVSALERRPGTDRDGGRSKGPYWGALCYTTEHTFVASRMLTRGSGNRVALNRASARRIVGLPGFRRAGAAAAERWYLCCAGGPDTSGKGTGTPEKWLWAGNVQHATFVVRSLGGAR